MGCADREAPKWKADQQMVDPRVTEHPHDGEKKKEGRGGDASQSAPVWEASHHKDTRPPVPRREREAKWPGAAMAALSYHTSQLCNSGNFPKSTSNHKKDRDPLGAPSRYQRLATNLFLGTPIVSGHAQLRARRPPCFSRINPMCLSNLCSLSKSFKMYYQRSRTNSSSHDSLS